MRFLDCRAPAILLLVSLLIPLIYFVAPGVRVPCVLRSREDLKPLFRHRSNNVVAIYFNLLNELTVVSVRYENNNNIELVRTF